MSSEIGAAIITLLGVVVTVYISFRATSRQLGVELQKIKQENKLAYTNHLLEKRMERYPLLYQIVCNFQNSIRKDGLSLKNLKKFYEDLQTWEVENSIFTSSKMKFVLFDMFKIIRTLLHKKESTFGLSYRKEVVQNLSRLELAMKSDIGVFLVEFPSSDRGYFDNYMELNQVNNEQTETETKPTESTT
jgi:hypothetical protein